VVKILIGLLQEHLKNKKPRGVLSRNYFLISEAGKKPFDIFRNLTSGLKHPAKIRRLHEIGRATHRRVCQYLDGMGLLEGYEIPVGDDLFKGIADAMIKLPYEEAMPLEIKTVGRKEFERILRKNAPSWSSYVQLQLYLHYLNKAKGRILFIETNTLEDFIMPLEEYRAEQRMKEFTIRKNPKIIMETLDRFRKLKEVFISGGVMTG
jgi:hypothetical protein